MAILLNSVFPFKRTQKTEDLDRKLVFSKRGRHFPRLTQWKRLPHLLTPKERWTANVALGILALSAVTAAALILRGQLSVKPLRGGTYREAVVGSPRLINPVLATLDVEKDLTRLMFSSLLRYNREGRLVGDLAERFEIDENGRAIHFTLRENARFHDGQPLTAKDAAFTLSVIKDPLWRSPLWRSFQNVEAVELDERSIVFRADALIPGFADLFTFGILPEHIWSQVAPESARLAVWNTKPVGSGPYQFASLAKYGDGTVQFYRLKAYGEYHRGAPYIKEIIIQFFSEFDSALGALREHTVEGVSFVPERLREKIPGSGVRAQRIEFPKFTALFFQDRNASILRDKNVRRALELALDRAEIAKLIADAQPIRTAFLESQLGHARTLPASAFDPEQARQTLIGAGWKNDEQGWAKGDQRLKLTLTAPDESSHLIAAGAVKQAWEKLGVEVKLEAVSRGAFELGILRPRSFEVLLFSIITGRDPDPYAFWHSTQTDDPGLNFSSVTSRNIDAALEQGRSTLEDQARLEAYLKFQEEFSKEAPAILLYVSPYVYAQSKRIRASASAVIYAPADRFNEVEKWFIRFRPAWQ